MWNLVWKADVSQELRVFAWKAATDTLAVRLGLHHRIPSFDLICTICGRTIEDGHHSLVDYTLACALRDEARKLWQLPPEDAFRKEWLLHLLRSSSKKTRSKLLFVL
jgi:hypothetical protein